MKNIILIFLGFMIYFLSCEDTENKAVEEKLHIVPVETVEVRKTVKPLGVKKPNKPQRPIKKEEPKLVRYEEHLEYRFTRYHYVTCYSDADDPGSTYANNQFAGKLHRCERRIQTQHYTVALNFSCDKYFRDLIEVYTKNIGREWTHKWRIHIPGYNTVTGKEDRDSSYYSLPRDRMPRVEGYTNYEEVEDRLVRTRNRVYTRDIYSYEDRLDVLFTTAGNYHSIPERQKYWALKNTHNIPCKYYEIVKYAVYSDGSKKKLQ